MADTATLPVETPPAPPPAVNPWMVAVAVMFGCFMEVLDTTVVNVSLPHIAGNLSATVDEATWVLTSYLVANAIILPMTGWLAQYFGRKRLLMLAVTGFTCASVLCGMAPTLGTLVVFRVIQGATGGALQPLSQAVMLEAFAPSERGKAMAFWGFGIVVAPMLGPILGGWLTENYSWRWVFYINVPVGVASILMTKMYVFDPSYLRRATKRIDTFGIGLLVLGIAALQMVLDKGQTEDWFESRLITSLALISVGALAWFIIHELRTAEPIVQLRVFRDRSYAVGVFLMTTLGFVLYGSLVILPVFLQTMMRYPALQAGLATAPRGLGAFIGMPLVGVIMSRVDPRKMLGLGLIAASLTLLQLSTLNADAGYWNFFWPQLFQGLSLSLLFVPLTTVTMNSIPKEQLGNAASLFNLMRNLGGGFGIAAATTMLFRNTQGYINRLGENVTTLSPAAQSLLSQLRASFQAAGADAESATQRAYAIVYGMVQQQASLLAYLHTFRLFGLIFLFALPLLALLRRPAQQDKPPAAMH